MVLTSAVLKAFLLAVYLVELTAVYLVDLLVALWAALTVDPLDDARVDLLVVLMGAMRVVLMAVY